MCQFFVKSNGCVELLRDAIEGERLIDFIGLVSLCKTAADFLCWPAELQLG